METMPVDIPPLIGRDALVSHLRDRLGACIPRICLTGPVGVGKSRLARHVVQEALVDGGLDNLRYVDLNDGEWAPEMTIAATLSVRHPEEVGERLASLHSTVLLLDNADGSLDQLKGWLFRWGREAPETVVVVTSRHIPEIPFEIVDGG